MKTAESQQAESAPPIVRWKHAKCGCLVKATLVFDGLILAGTEFEIARYCDRDVRLKSGSPMPPEVDEIINAAVEKLRLAAEAEYHTEVISRRHDFLGKEPS
jgi:hypothetical protein